METFYLYLLLLVGVYLEGETALLTASFLANQGMMNLWVVLSLAFVGTVATDWFHFWLGRWQGKAFLDKRPKLQKQFYRFNRLIEKRPNTVSFFYRYLYGFRIVLPVALGMSRINALNFLFFSALSALIWTLGFGLLGYYFGEVVRSIFNDFQAYQKFLVLSLITGGILFTIFWAVYTRKKEVS